MSADWIKSDEFLVEHLRRRSEGKNGGTADWMIVARPGSIGSIDVITRWGKTGSTPQEKAWSSYPNIDAGAVERACRDAERAADVKRADGRYVSVMSETLLKRQHRYRFHARTTNAAWEKMRLRLQEGGFLLERIPFSPSSTKCMWLVEIPNSDLEWRVSSHVIHTGSPEEIMLVSSPKDTLWGWLTFAAVIDQEIGIHPWRFGLTMEELRKTLQRNEANLSSDMVKVGRRFGLFPAAIDFAAIAMPDGQHPWATVF